ncbi:MAG: hypothetical protein OJF48_001926 [Afipia sp.]|jgi:DNA-binding transcriptional MocR family regulator|nr:MAG: hypothetical protein OJF48_001926 [Afipia sp.]
MSWKATAWAVKQQTGSPARKLLLLTLANYADASGTCWPSQETLAADTEQSIDTVQRQTKKLVALGLVRIAPRPQGRGRWAGRTYYLNMPASEMTEPQSAVRSDTVESNGLSGGLTPATEPQSAVSPSRTENGDQAATSTVTMPHSCAVVTSKEPSLKPSAEPSSGERKPTAVERQVAFQGKRQGIEVIQNKIATRLGPEGWLILAALPVDELDAITALEERHRLSPERLQLARLKASGAAA